MTVPLEAFETCDRERRALNMEADTYRMCIEDAGGLEALCALVREYKPVHASSPPELAAWMAWCKAGGIEQRGARLPWCEVRWSPRTSTALGAEAPSGASRRFRLRRLVAA